jgi:hypothetical protein
MGEFDWVWIGIGSLPVGGAAVLWGVTNGRIKLQLSRPPSMAERLARYPTSAGAVVIKAQRRRALMRMLPGAILTVPLVLAVQFLPAHTVTALLCEYLGPTEAVHWLLRMFFPGLPVMLAIAAIFAVNRSLRVLRGGYAPPLDSVVLHDTIAVTGWRAKLNAWLVLTVMPMMVVVSFYVTHAFVQTFDTEANRQTLGAAKCPQHFSTKEADRDRH